MCLTRKMRRFIVRRLLVRGAMELGMERAMEDRTISKFKRGVGFAAMAMGLLVAALSIGAPKAEAANLLQKNFWLPNQEFSGNIPACDEPSALGLIASRFAQTERRFWSSDLAITEFGPVKEIAFRPWGQSYVPRRYCSGTVYTNDAKKRPIYYSIIEDGGFIGASWGVEWCIVGLDRNYADAPDCKMARP